jgi:hypothetical protein
MEALFSVVSYRPIRWCGYGAESPPRALVKIQDSRDTTESWILLCQGCVSQTRECSSQDGLGGSPGSPGVPLLAGELEPCAPKCEVPWFASYPISLRLSARRLLSTGTLLAGCASDSDAAHGRSRNPAARSQSAAVSDSGFNYPSLLLGFPMDWPGSQDSLGATCIV